MSNTRNSIETFAEAEVRVEPSAEFRKAARIGSREEYDRLYRESLDAPESFWRRELGELVFRSPWTELCEWNPPHAKWFKGASLNVTESCLDRHLTTSARN